MSVYKPEKSRFWQYDFQYKGRRFHGSTGVETRRKAEQVERNKREAVALGVSDEPELTLDQAAGKWWDEVGQHRAAPTKIWRRINTVLRLVGKNRPITEISTSIVSTAIEKRRGETWSRTDKADAKGRPPKRYPLSNATVNADIIDTLRPILMRARKVWEVPGLKEINWKDLRLEEADEIVQFYTAEQQAAWTGACDATSKFPLRLLLKYGLRFGELFFPPEAYDPDGPRLVLNKRKNKVHVVPLTAADARQIAARVGRAKAARLPHIWFEEAPDGKLVSVSYAALHSRLRKAAKRAGLTLPRLIHGARHHAGTTILRETKNLKLTQKLLGHRNIQSTMRYAHALEDELREALESRNSPEPAAAEGDFAVPKQLLKGRKASLS